MKPTAVLVEDWGGLRYRLDPDLIKAMKVMPEQNWRWRSLCLPCNGAKSVEGQYTQLAEELAHILQPADQRPGKAADLGTDGI